MRCSIILPRLESAAPVVWNLEPLPADIQVIRPTGAHGLAAWNAGATQAQGDVLVFLDEATTPQPGWLDALLNYADAHPDVDIIGSTLLYPQGLVRQMGYVIGQDRLPHPLYAGFPAHHPVLRQSRPLQAVAGVGMLVRRAMFATLEGFALAYGHIAAVDLCLRLGERGGAVHVCAASRLVHAAPEPGGLIDADLAAYRQRWAEHVTPDDLSIYLADGLAKVDYTPAQAVRLTISPRVATLGGHRRELHDQLLETRIDQLATVVCSSLAQAALPPPLTSAIVDITEPSAPLIKPTDLPPFPYPPPDLVFRVVGAAGLDYFLNSGQMTEEDFRLALADAGKTYDDCQDILDFGCGSGRVTRWLRARATRSRVYGSDIDIPAVTWLRRSLPGVDVRVNNYLPPLPFRDGQFDLIMAFSVFTHLDADFQDAWLTELHRVTRPGAILLLTVHGEYAWQHFSQTTHAQLRDVEALAGALRQSGFVFWRGDGWESHFPDYYHSSWHLPVYIHTHWARWFSVLGIRERGARTIQDMVVLRREA